MREFKYYSTFATKHIRIVYPNEISKSLALASLKDLKDVLPAGLDIEGNPDLVFNSFNAVVVNRVNLNDDGIGTKDALAIAKKFIHKPMDLEHNRKFIVGALISQGYSEFLTNKILTEDEVKDLNGSFNITLGGVVWSVFNPDFAHQLIESSDETSPTYEAISASWEIGFDEYHIALGDRDLSQAEMITDPKQVEEFYKYLKVAKGSGQTDDGIPVYRVITGDALPLGIGYTTTPAADVKGVLVASSQPKDADVKFGISKEDLVVAINTSINTFKKETIDRLEQIAVTQKESMANQENKKNNSHLGNHTVKSNSIMKLKTLEDITVDLFKDETVGAAVTNFVGKFVNDKIDEASTNYAEKLQTQQAKQTQADTAAAELQKKLEDALTQVSKAQEDLKKEQEIRATAKVESDFNMRMSDLDSKYNLEDKDRGFIAQDIKGLDDETYAKWVEKFEVFAGSKKKKAADDAEDLADKGADEEAEDKKKKKAAKGSAEQILDNTKENKDKLPPNNTETETTLRQEFADAFKLEDFKIKK